MDDSDIRLSTLSPDDPKQFLTPEARKRIIRTQIEAQRIARDAEIEGTRERYEYGWVHANTVLDVYCQEYCKVAPCLQIYQRWMRDEVEAACYALELCDDQETALQSKYAYPPPEISPPSVDPLSKFIRASDARFKEAIRDLLAVRDAKYREIAGMALAGGCIGRGGKRFEALVMYHKEIVRKRVEAYKSVADESDVAEMLSPIRMHTLRETIKNEIRYAYLGIKDRNHQDCRAAGDGSPDALRAMDLRSPQIEAQIFSAASTLIAVIESNRNALMASRLDLAAPAVSRKIATVVKAGECTRSSEVNAFLKACNEQSDVIIRRNHIWKSIGHSSGKQFERWQSRHPKTTQSDEINFGRILSRGARRFLDDLRKSGHIK